MERRQDPQGRGTTLQLERGWQPNPLFGYGGVYEGEWDEVIKKGWRLPEGWSPDEIREPEIPFTKWGDYSQYQTAYVETYPYEVIAFRASVADQEDDKWLEEHALAKELVKQGKLKKIIAYHFWVPGLTTGAPSRGHRSLRRGVPGAGCMLDIEDGGDKWHVRGDQTPGVKDWITKAEAYFVNKQATSIYLNFRANAGLLVGINDIELRGVKLIVPSYHGPDEPPYRPGSAGLAISTPPRTPRRSGRPTSTCRRCRWRRGWTPGASMPH